MGGVGSIMDTSSPIALGILDSSINPHAQRHLMMGSLGGMGGQHSSARGVWGGGALPGWGGADRRSQLLHGERKSTDLWAAVIFLGLLAYMSLWAVRANFEGDTRKLWHGRDFKGRFCGLSRSEKGKPYVFWPTNPTTLLIDPAAPICVPRCFSSADAEMGVIVSYPNITATAAPQPQASSAEPWHYHFVDSLVYDTAPFGGTYCFPSDFKQAAALAQRSGTTGFMMSVSRGMKTVSGSWPWLMLFASLAVLVGVAYIAFLRYLAGPLLLLCLTLTPLVTIAFGVYFLVCGLMGSSYPIAAKVDLLLNFTTVMLGLILGVLGALLLVCVVFLRESAQTAFSILESSIDCFWSIPKLAFLPFLWVAVGLSAYFIGISTLLHIFSASDLPAWHLLPATPTGPHLPLQPLPAPQFPPLHALHLLLGVMLVEKSEP